MRAVVLFAALFSCAQPQTTVPPRADRSESQEAPLRRVIFPDGYAVQVELAIDPETRTQGLMHRDRLPEDRGMLFVFPQPAVHSFWMKNTLIPLDMIWIDEARKVVHVKYDVPPCQADPCPGYDPGVPAKYVLEVAAGVARRHSLAAGDEVRFEGMENIRVN